MQVQEHTHTHSQDPPVTRNKQQSSCVLLFSFTSIFSVSLLRASAFSFLLLLLSPFYQSLLFYYSSCGIWSSFHLSIPRLTSRWDTVRFSFSSVWEAALQGELQSREIQTKMDSFKVRCQRETVCNLGCLKLHLLSVLWFLFWFLSLCKINLTHSRTQLVCAWEYTYSMTVVPTTNLC